MAVYIPTIGRRPDLFLSHSSDDSEFALKLADDLNVCEVDVWIDKWEIEIGDSLFEKISNAISDSRYIAMVFTNSFLKKKWSSAEVKAAFAKEINNEDKVILPLLLEDVERPSLLADKLYISFDGNYYEALTQLAGVVHGLGIETIERAIRKMRPASLEDVVNTLAYSGKDPYMIIPKDVFDEIAASGYADVYENRLRFPFNFHYKLGNVSQRAEDYLNRIQIGTFRDRRGRQVQ